MAARHRPVGRTRDPTFDDGFKITQTSGENLFIQMFEPLHAGDEMRVAQSPSGGGPGNPAWNFVCFRRDHAVGCEFSLRVRTVCRNFTKVEDIVRLYERWAGKQVHLPPE